MSAKGCKTVKCSCTKFIRRCIFIAVAVLTLIITTIVVAAVQAPYSQAIHAGVIALVMALLWITEAVPLPVTALMPVALFPFYGIISASEVSALYFNDTVFMMLGSFILGDAFGKRRLHKRFALTLLMRLGHRPWGLLFAFMLSTFIIAMWMSNTACVAMMTPLVEVIFATLRNMILAPYVTPSHPAGTYVSSTSESDIESIVIPTVSRGAPAAAVHVPMIPVQLIQPTPEELAAKQGTPIEVVPIEMAHKVHTPREQSIQPSLEEVQKPSAAETPPPIQIPQEKQVSSAPEPEEAKATEKQQPSATESPRRTIPSDDEPSAAADKHEEHVHFKLPAGHDLEDFPRPSQELRPSRKARGYMRIRALRRRRLIQLKHFRESLLLAVVYACAFGGLMTLIGSPANLVLVSTLRSLYGDVTIISFVTWMGFMAPLCFVSLILSFLFFGYTRCPKKLYIPMEPLMKEYRQLHKMRWPDYAVLINLCVLLVLWVVQSFDVLPVQVQPGTLAMLLCIVMFMIPSDTSGAPLMNWEDTLHVNWGVLLLIGGGFALSGGLRRSGVMDILALPISAMRGFDPIIIVFVSTAIVLALTQLMPSTSTANLMHPLLAVTATAMNQNPLLLLLPAVISNAGCFTLPASTPPNAIVVATGHVKTSYMFKTGIVSSVLFAALGVACVYSYGRPMFGIVLNEVPSWAQ